MTRTSDEDELIMFGLQAFIKEYLTKSFNENILSRAKDKVLDRYIHEGICEDENLKVKIDWIHEMNLHKLNPKPIYRSLVKKSI